MKIGRTAKRVGSRGVDERPDISFFAMAHDG